MPTAIITGGAVRIGKALACHLADQGWHLALHHNASDPAEVLAHAKKAGVTCKTYPGDLTDLAFAEALIGQVTADGADVQQGHLRLGHRRTRVHRLHLGHVLPQHRPRP